MTISSATGGARTRPATIETRASWVIALTALGIYSLAFGAPIVTVVALKQIAADLGGGRSVPALAYSLAWLGSAVGGIAMGRIAERVGVRWTVSFGAIMVGLGLVVSATGGLAGILVGHGLFIGLLGNAGINAPLYVYISRWFDRRRGTALALIASGPQLAGLIWPIMFERMISVFDWRQTMLVYAAGQVAIVVPVALFMFGPAPEPAGAHVAAGPSIGASVLGWRPRTVQVLLCCAGFLCCVPMAMPQSHLVAFCSDLGIPAVRGAAMLSLLLGCGCVSRQSWGAR